MLGGLARGREEQVRHTLGLLEHGLSVRALARGEQRSGGVEGELEGLQRVLRRALRERTSA